MVVLAFAMASAMESSEEDDELIPDSFSVIAGGEYEKDDLNCSMVKERVRKLPVCSSGQEPIDFNRVMDEANVPDDLRPMLEDLNRNGGSVVTVTVEPSMEDDPRAKNLIEHGFVKDDDFYIDDEDDE